MPAPLLQIKRIQNTYIPADLGLDITIRLNGVDRVFSIGAFNDNSLSTINPEGVNPPLGTPTTSGPGSIVDLANILQGESAINQNYDVNVVNNELLVIVARQDDPRFNFGDVDGTLINNVDPQFNKWVIEANTTASGTDNGTGSSTQSSSPIVESLVFSLPDIYPSLTNPYAFGNLADKQKLELTFVLPQQLAAGENVVYYNNFVQSKQELDVYGGNGNFQGSSSNNYEIKPDPFFINRVTQDVQRFSGAVGTLNAQNSSKSFVKGTVTLVDLGAVGGGGHRYRIDHEFRLTDFITPNEVDEDLLFNNRYPQFIFRIDVSGDVLNPNNFTTSTNNIDLSSFFLDGSIGYFNDVLGSAINNDYNIIQIPTTTIEKTKDTDYTFQIKNNAGNFSATTQLLLRSQEIGNQNLKSRTYLENIEFSEVNFTADGSSNSNSVFNNVTASLNADPSIIDISFTVLQGVINTDYALFIAVNNDSLNYNHVNLLIEVDAPEANGDDEKITLGTYTGATSADMRFTYHYQNIIGDSFNHVKGFVEDRYLCEWQIVNLDTDNITVNNITVGIFRQTGGSFIDNEQFIINESSIPFNSERSFNYADDDPKRLVTVSKQDNGDSTADYNFQYGFQIWESWLQFNDLVLSCVFNVTQSLNDGTSITFDKEILSPVFELGNYDETKNTNTEPQVFFSQALLANESNVILDGNGIITNPVNNILCDSDTRIQFIFDEINLGDLQTNNFVGYIGITKNNQQGLYYTIHSEDIIPSAAPNPLKEVSGHTANRAKITRLTGISQSLVMIEAVVDYQLLISILGGQDFELSARIDKKDPVSNLNITLTIEE